MFCVLHHQLIWYVCMIFAFGEMVPFQKMVAASQEDAHTPVSMSMSNDGSASLVQPMKRNPNNSLPTHSLTTLGTIHFYVYAKIETSSLQTSCETCPMTS